MTPGVGQAGAGQPSVGQADDVLRLAAEIRIRDDRLSPLAAGIVAALSMEIAGDSRSFAGTFGIAHALVLREINLMAEPGGPVTILSRDPRTQRTHLSLSKYGEALAIRSAVRS